MHGQHRLSVGAKEHQVGLPVTWSAAVLGALRTLGKGASEVYEGSGTPSLATPPAPLRLPARQVVTPRVALLPDQLSIDEPIDALVRDDPLATLQGRTTTNLLRRPALFEAGEHLCTQSLVSLQPRPTPPTRPGPLVRIHRLVPSVLRPIPLQLPSNCRCRTIHICSDLPDRAPSACSRAIAHLSSIVTCLYRFPMATS